jgi:tetratricopeptide (TPR) repeat protein
MPVDGCRRMPPRFLIAGLFSARTRRAVLFRVAAIFLGLMPLLAIEMALRMFDLGRPSRQADPFVGFSSMRPLFELNDKGDRYEIPRSRLTHFRPESFPAQKEPREFRIFCIGDSTVQGNPWAIETSFTTWLEISLNAADASRRWDVINCGGISYASYRLLPILEELLRYQPDLFIVHCSHNEFLEDRTYGDIKQTPWAIRRLHEQVSRLRLYNLLRADWLTLTRNADNSRSQAATDAGTDDAPKPRNVLAAEVEALLDYRGGLEFYHRDEAWHRGVIAHHEFNLRRMATTAREAGVPLILMNPACNLRDSPPFKSQHREDLSDEELKRWDDLWTQARQHYKSRHHQAVPLLRQALAIDHRHAGLHYDLAKSYDALGRFQEARQEYLLAKELDVCPLRILESMNRSVLRVADETKTPVVDMRGLFDRLSRDGIPGGDWFVDHVHPTIAGYRRIADELADELVRQGFVQPGTNWKEVRQRKYAGHLSSLDTMYFIRSQRRLTGLMNWAQGRSRQTRPQKRLE